MSAETSASPEEEGLLPDPEATAARTPEGNPRRREVPEEEATLPAEAHQATPDARARETTKEEDVPLLPAPEARAQDQPARRKKTEVNPRQARTREEASASPPAVQELRSPTSLRSPKGQEATAA